MAKIPVVDENTCIGCTACVGVCPGVFRMNAQNKSEVHNAQGDTEENVQHAIDVCPAQAISWKK